MWKETTGIELAVTPSGPVTRQGRGRGTRHTQSGKGITGYSHAFEFPSCWRAAVYPEQVLGEDCAPFTSVSQPLVQRLFLCLPTDRKTKQIDHSPIALLLLNDSATD